MVDINLFKDEGEEKKDQDWKSNSDEGEEKKGGEEDLEDAFGLGDETESLSSLDDEALLSDEEAVPDFEESEEDEKDEDYDFRDSKEKRSSIWLWALLGVLVIGVLLYIFVYQPRQLSKKFKPVRAVRKTTTIPDSTVKSKETRPAMSTIQADSGVVSPVSSSIIRYVNASKSVVESLAREGQFASILLQDNRFSVEYVSESPGVSQAMGHRIQTLLGSEGFKVSPEDRHRTAGKTYYWGVVSGELPGKLASGKAAGVKRFSTTEDFIREMKQYIQKHQLTDRGIQKFASTEAKSPRIRIKVEGDKEQALHFLDSLKSYGGNYELSKLFLTSLNYPDFSARQVKLVLDFSVYI